MLKNMYHFDEGERSQKYKELKKREESMDGEWSEERQQEHFLPLGVTLTSQLSQYFINHSRYLAQDSAI